MPFGTDITSLVTLFTTSGIKVSIKGVEQQNGITLNNFSAPVTYTVTAADGSMAVYTVTVTIALSSANNLTGFSLNGTKGIIAGRNIAVTMPFGTDVTALTASFITSGSSVSIGQAVQQNGITPNNFSTPITYTITAADGSTATYTVKVTVAPNFANAITAFSINNVPGIITRNNIAVTVPFGTNITDLVATFATSGTSVFVGGLAQTTGATENNFSAPVIYTVTAADGSVATYTVTVSVALNSAKTITAFSINNVPGIITGNNIAVTVPFGTDVTDLVATFATSGASVSIGGVRQTSGATPGNDFSTPVTYTVTAADGSVATYTVTVSVALNSAKTITAFSINNVPGIITGNNIAVTVPFGTDVTDLVATFATSGASISIGGEMQTSGTTPGNDFSTPVTYTVTAADGSVATYTVTVIVALSSSNMITAFSINNVPGIITGNNIAVTVPFGTDLTDLVATFATSGDSVSAHGVKQTSGTSPGNDFSTPVTYIVTAADGSVATYTVTVSVALNSAKTITAFSINNVPGVITGNDIAVTVPFGTDLTNLVATFATSGDSVFAYGVRQTSGTSPGNDFTSPVAYTVTAADGTETIYTVTVTIARNSAKDITAFSINNAPGVITGHDIAVTVPFGTDVTDLVATFTTSGASVSVDGKIRTSGTSPGNDFTNPVAYTVTAADGTETIYTVTVTIARNSAKDITEFSINNAPGVITGNDIAVTVPFGTDVTDLVATFATSGDNVSVDGEIRTSGTTPGNDFSNPVSYTVTAADGSEAIYIVTVTVAPNSAKTITAFSLTGTSGKINESNIAVTVPSGTNLANLIATFTTTGTRVSIGKITQTSGATPNDFSELVTYTVTAADGSEAIYTVTVTTANQSGQLSFLPIPSIPSGTNPGDLVISPNGNFAYATISAESKVLQYSIDSTTGQLSLLLTSIATGSNPFTIAITPNGKFAYVSNASESSLSQYSIDLETGTLTYLSTPKISIDGTPYGITISPNSNFAYVAINNMNIILQYKIDAITGELSLLASQTVATGQAPRRIAIANNGKFAYVSNANGNTISQYSIDDITGQLVPLSNPTVNTGATPFGIVISPNGKFAYVFNSTGNSLSQYSISDTSGELTPLSTPTINTGFNPRRIAITPTGNFLYVSNNIGNSISEYRIDQVTGLLRPLPDPIIKVSRPLGMVVSPNGKFVYVSNNTGNTLSQFKIN